MDILIGSLFITTLWSIEGSMAGPRYQGDASGQSGIIGWAVMGPTAQENGQLTSSAEMASSDPTNLQGTSGGFQSTYPHLLKAHHPDHSSSDDVIAIKVKQAMETAQILAKEAAEKEAIVAMWRAKEAEQLNALGGDHGSNSAMQPHNADERQEKTTQKQAEEQAYQEPQDMIRAEEESYGMKLTTHNEPKETKTSLTAYQKVMMDRETALAALSSHSASEKNSVSSTQNLPSLGAAYGNTGPEGSSSYADAEAAIAQLVSKNSAAALTPSEVSAELTKPYYGPLATPYVLPSGYLAYTDEVFAARQNHLRALEEAESAASIWKQKEMP